MHILHTYMSQYFSENLSSFDIMPIALLCILFVLIEGKLVFYLKCKCFWKAFQSCNGVIWRNFGWARTRKERRISQCMYIIFGLNGRWSRLCPSLSHQPTASAKPFLMLSPGGMERRLRMKTRCDVVLLMYTCGDPERRRRVCSVLSRRDAWMDLRAHSFPAVSAMMLTMDFACLYITSQPALLVWPYFSFQ